MMRYHPILRRTTPLLLGLLASWLLVAIVAATGQIGAAVRFNNACSNIHTLADVPAAAQRVSASDDATYVIGYRQVSSINQDAILVKFSAAGEKVWCRQDYDTAPPDSRGYGLLWREPFLYAVFSVDGGGSGFDALADGWLRSYNDASSGGGGPHVAVILQIQPESGDALHGTFITSRLSSGAVNSLQVTEMCGVGENVRVVANAWYSPRRTDRTRIPNCAGASPLDYVIEFTPDLRQATAVSSFACGEVNPALVGGCAVPQPRQTFLPLLLR